MTSRKTAGRDSGRRLRERIAEFSDEIGLDLSAEQRRRLILLDTLVEEWSRAVSLTGFRSERQRHERYFLEALHASRWLPVKGEAIDIGSGGGTPALPLAVGNQDLHWTLLEPNRKKAQFLEEASRSLGLANVNVERVRFQNYRVERWVNVVTTRGLAVGDDLIRFAKERLQAGGSLLLLTGRKPALDIEPRLASEWEIRVRCRLGPGGEAQLLRATRL